MAALGMSCLGLVGGGGGAGHPPVLVLGVYEHKEILPSSWLITFEEIVLSHDKLEMFPSYWGIFSGGGESSPSSSFLGSNHSKW